MRLPDQVERLLGGIEGVRGVRELAAGGSAATVLRIDRPEAGDLVLKLQVARPDLVDGHDLATFRRKQRQLAHLRPRAPAVWRRYPRVLHELNGDGWSAVLMP